MSDVEEVDVVKEERLKKIWGDDKLGRRADADYLIRFLTHRIEERGEGEKSYVLNINSQWGGGKTFFLKRFGDHLEWEGYLVARVNAWTDDHCEDPLISVMAAMEAEIVAHLKESEPLRSAWKKVRKFADPIVSASAVGGGMLISGPIQKITGVNLFDAVKEWRKARKQKHKESETVIDCFVQEKKTIGGFKTAFSKFLRKLDKERNLPFVILVDEMDRCRPPYAIALLERVKHLFNIDNVVFVFATDTEQLSHSIGAVYGVKFESRKYLQRFFDQTYLFEEPRMEKFVDYLVQKYGLIEENISWEADRQQSLSFHLTSCFQIFGLDLRSVEQCVSILRNIVTVWGYEKLSIKGIVLLPMIIAHQQQWEHINYSSTALEEFQGDGRNGFSDWRVNISIESEVWHSVHDAYLAALSALKSKGGLGNLEAEHLQLLKNQPSLTRSKMFCWVIEQVKHEQSIAGGMSHMSEKTVLETYPAIVRSAGRFAQLEP